MVFCRLGGKYAAKPTEIREETAWGEIYCRRCRNGMIAARSIHIGEHAYHTEPGYRRHRCVRLPAGVVMQVVFWRFRYKFSYAI
jgi:hypothetical protein